MNTQDTKDKAEIVESNGDSDTDDTVSGASDRCSDKPTEVGGRGGLDPARYGDWEKAGRCIDF